ncbi:putative oxidoreductase [Arthrobacter globiformis NBRC 12137]|uniref:Putative oxidoreductase n=1 Tax=Arthrobacter globiformis (strain ATCC 8010 / DSM 20124 / JCM 1332 / NBRC 12137 / NCIMB 8907 / NRRL B-2979 / 168) TaxID=1077972 RepID=H0QU87_ARTG1|nr:putative oxidoreductase [Arthrobacter globiformis NBRC 12137]
MVGMKRIGFLSFGHWGPVQGSRTRTARDALLQGIELAVAAEELGIDGAFFRVHHFARQQASPFPLLAAAAARTRRIELGTGVIDMRYENPLYMAEEAAATDLISGGRLQLGISRGSPEPARNGAAAFGHAPREGETDADMARRHAEEFRQAISGAGRGGGRSPVRRRGHRAAPCPAPIRGAARADLVGRRNPEDSGLGGGARDEPHELHLADRGYRGTVPRAPGRADSDVP